MDKKGSKQAFVFCDFSKAFDSVWHKCLLQTLKSHGITGHLLKWFKSYLENMEQRVVIEHAMSPVCGVLAGVSQGSMELDDWSKKWFGTFNPDKTEVLMISNMSIPNINITSKIKHFHC